MNRIQSVLLVALTSAACTAKNPREVTSSIESKKANESKASTIIQCRSSFFESGKESKSGSLSVSFTNEPLSNEKNSGVAVEIEGNKASVETISSYSRANQPALSKLEKSGDELEFTFTEKTCAEDCGNKIKFKSGSGEGEETWDLDLKKMILDTKSGKLTVHGTTSYSVYLNNEYVEKTEKKEIVFGSCKAEKSNIKKLEKSLNR